MTEKQETNYFKCGDCRNSAILALLPGQHLRRWIFCPKLTDDDFDAGWQDRPACDEFEEEK